MNDIDYQQRLGVSLKPGRIQRCCGALRAPQHHIQECIEVVVPPRSILEQLLGLVEENRIQALRSHLEVLKTPDISYSAFVEPLLYLTQQFQTEKIEEHLQHYLTRAVTHAQ